jgi:hypothetical protein
MLLMPNLEFHFFVFLLKGQIKKFFFPAHIDRLGTVKMCRRSKCAGVGTVKMYRRSKCAGIGTVKMCRAIYQYCFKLIEHLNLTRMISIMTIQDREEKNIYFTVTKSEQYVLYMVMHKNKLPKKLKFTSILWVSLTAVKLLQQEEPMDVSWIGIHMYIHMPSKIRKTVMGGVVLFISCDIAL